MSSFSTIGSQGPFDIYASNAAFNDSCFPAFSVPMAATFLLMQFLFLGFWNREPQPSRPAAAAELLGSHLSCGTNHWHRGYFKQALRDGPG